MDILNYDEVATNDEVTLKIDLAKIAATKGTLQ